LEEKLAGIGELDLSNVRGVLTVLTFEALLREVAHAHEATELADVDSIVVRDIEKSLLEETCSTMRDHAVTFHLTEPQATIS